VNKGASPDELKKAFKAKAREYHPDRNPDDAAAEERFKEINEAYAVLSDPQKRREYDQFGANGFRQRYSRDDIFQSADFGDLGDILGGLGGDLFSRIFGAATGRGPRRGCGRKGRDIETEVTVTLDEILAGGKRRLSLQGPRGIVSLDVTIPKGVIEDQKLRITGKGQPSPGGGPPGDLLIRVRIASHELFRMDGVDLAVPVDIPVTTLVLGGSVDVPIPGGGERSLKVEAGTRSGARIRIRGFGLPARNGERGDLYVEVNASLPEKLTSEQRELFEQLRDLSI